MEIKTCKSGEKAGTKYNYFDSFNWYYAAYTLRRAASSYQIKKISVMLEEE